MEYVYLRGNLFCFFRGSGKGTSLAGSVMVTDHPLYGVCYFDGIYYRDHCKQVAAYACVGLQPPALSSFWSDLYSLYYHLFRACGYRDHIKRISDVLAVSGTEASLLYLINVYEFVPFKSTLKMLY